MRFAVAKQLQPSPVLRQPRRIVWMPQLGAETVATPGHLRGRVAEDVLRAAVDVAGGAGAEVVYVKRVGNSLEDLLEQPVVYLVHGRSLRYAARLTPASTRGPIYSEFDPPDGFARRRTV